jgi:hypothetical protein
VSQELVRRYWPNDEPLGKRVRLDSGSPYFEVIGVVPDLENPRLNSAIPVVYVPFGQGKTLLGRVRAWTPPYQMQFLIRASGDPAGLKSLLRQDVLATNSSLWINVQTLEELRESSLVPIRTISMMLTALGSLALLMASVGFTQFLLMR